MSDRKKYVECAGGCPEHMLKFTHDPEDGFFAVYVLLVEQPFFTRLWRALKYLFGYKCRYGHFDEIILSPESAADLALFLEQKNELADRN